MKKQDVVNLGLLGGVSDAEVKLHSVGETLPCCELVFSIPVHYGKQSAGMGLLPSFPKSLENISL